MLMLMIIDVLYTNLLLVLTFETIVSVFEPYMRCKLRVILVFFVYKSVFTLKATKIQSICSNEVLASAFNALFSTVAYNIFCVSAL